MHEHPQLATSEVPCIKRLTELPEVVVAVRDMCQFGMKSRDKDGEGYAKKPTKFMTNSIELYKTLNRRCKPGSHRHVQLMEGRAAAAAKYPKGLFKAVVAGTKNQAQVDGERLASMKIAEDKAYVQSVGMSPDSERQWFEYRPIGFGGKVRKGTMRQACADKGNLTCMRIKDEVRQYMQSSSSPSSG